TRVSRDWSSDVCSSDLQGGDEAGPDRQPGGLLGAEIVADPSGYFRVEHVFPGNNWENGFRSPLTEPGSNVAEGSYILAVDGVDRSEERRVGKESSSRRR